MMWQKVKVEKASQLLVAVAAITAITVFLRLLFNGLCHATIGLCPKIIAATAHYVFSDQLQHFHVYD